MTDSRLRALTQMNMFGGTIDVLICIGDSVATPLSFERQAPDIATEPTFRLRKDAAQELIDGLWQCGLRPSEGTGSAGALAATQAHLQDMRALVFELNTKPREPK